MTMIAHISDLHFGRAVPAVVEGLERCLDDIQPDLVIISGDLTQRASHYEYLEAVRFVQALSWPTLTIPGNHDMPAYNNVPERFMDPWRRWRRYFSETLEPSCSIPGARVVGVNTARRAGPYLDWSKGRINRQQLLSIEERLRQAPENALRVVVAHHPFWLPENYSDRGLIGRRDEALAALSANGVDLILSGHVHLSYDRVISGVIISHAGTTTSDRVLPGHPNSFVVLDGDRQRLSLTRLIWNGEAFSRSAARDFRRSQSGWISEHEEEYIP